MSEDPRTKARKDLFRAALALPGTERDRYLSEHSADPDLRREVEFLLSQAGDATHDMPESAAHNVPSINTGDRIGHYIVDTALGAGGMGIVYKAHDTRLERPVVLKFVLPGKDHSPDRASRFALEAKAASGLNHPGIVTIYEVGEWHGASYIAMEFVEGRTLRQIIASQGRLPVSQALDYGIQMADAMAAAHTQGIVHRDLKPANIVVNPRGQVKILDFGLAKRVAPFGSASSASGNDRNAEDEPRTKAGVIMGSFHYMSPEQAKGGAVDHRSDVFSLGLMLHEMLTGTKPFKGDTAAEVVGAILRDEPAAPSATAPDVPPQLDWVTRHCLSKEPGRRFQSMQELKVALEDIRDLTQTVRDGHTVIAPVPDPPPKRPWLLWATMSVAVGALTASVYLWTNHGSATAPSRDVKLTPLTTDKAVNIDPAISPDGKLLVYVSNRLNEERLDLWIKQVDTSAAPVRLTDTPEAESEPRFSPDGGSIVFRSERNGGGIYSIPSLGGTPRLMVEGGRSPHLSPDGKTLLYWTGKIRAPIADDAALWVVDADLSSPPRRLAKQFATSAVGVWSPTGDRVLFLGKKMNEPSLSWWTVPVSADISKAEQWPQGDNQCRPAEWLENRVVCASTNEIRELRLEARGSRPASSARLVRVTTGTLTEQSPSVTRDGKHLVFAAVASDSNIFSIPFLSETGANPRSPERIAGTVAKDGMRSMSFDEKRFALSRRTSETQVWTLDASSGQRFEITKGGVPKGVIQLSPDGRWVSFRDKAPGISVAPFEGGPVRELGGRPQGEYRWHPDSRSILFRGKDDANIWRVELDTGAETLAIPARDKWLSPWSITRDGRWLAASEGSRDSTLYLIPLSPDGKELDDRWIRIPRSPKAQWAASFSPGGRMVYYSDASDGHNCIWAQRIDLVSRAAVGAPFPAVHFHSESLSTRVGLNFPPVLGSNRLLMNLEERSAEIWLLEER